MKSLFSSLLCASLLVVAVGCGKDNKSGGGGGVPPYQNLTGNGLSVGNQQVLQKVTNWYNGSTEGYPVVGPVNVVKETKVYNTQPTCEEKKFLGIPYTKCSFDGTPTTSTENVVLNIVQDGRLIKDKGNAELNAVFSGAAGTLISAIDISQHQSQLSFLRNDGAVVIYGINRNRNSQLNPEFKRVTTQAQQTDITIR